MSVQSWKIEYYPVMAIKIRAKLSAIKHSIRKWRGFRKEALERHELYHYKADNSLVSTRSVSDRFQISGANCALCLLYEPDGCGNCPIFQLRKCESCDYPLPLEVHSPYGEWVANSNPEPMLELLYKALKLEEKKRKRRRGK